MKKELHLHHEDAGTALELLYGIVKKRPNLHFGVEKHLLEQVNMFLVERGM